ncbi:hypothetical protein F1880_003721, partial [Penicillium rolfsii]
IYCHLCGVSFNIARRRKPGEPDLASWDYTGEQCDEPGVDEVDLEQCARNGCFVATKISKGDDDDMLDDPDYVPPDETDYNEPYKYDSESESADSMSISGEEDANNDSESNFENEDSEVKYYSEWLAETMYLQFKFAGEPVRHFDLFDQRRRNESVFPIQANTLSDYEPEQLEHIPSRTCTEARAYSGFAISLEEMNGCRTAQCLVHKSAIQDQSRPIEFLEPWEASEDWFLSGLCDGLPSRDCYNLKVWPAQGGVDHPRAENVNFAPEWTPARDWAMPFHPWCFDIFCRQSKARFNRVNISGLMKWRDAEFSYEDFHSFPWSGDVFEGQDQWWEHVPGREYLAANPLYVPGLETFLLDAGKLDEVPSHDKMELSELASENHTSMHIGHDDVFASMPPEIRLLIVSFLDARDFANLRMASRAFSRIPNSVWRRLVHEEMPWLWEAWSEGENVHVPSFWTTVTANDLLFFKEVRERYSAHLNHGDLPISEAVNFLLPFQKEAPNQVRLPWGDTNWHGVYTQIKKNWSSLKGLRNRQRIWEAVEEIIKRIEKYESQV